MAQHSAKAALAKGPIPALVTAPSRYAKRFLTEYAADVAVFAQCSIIQLHQTYDALTLAAEALYGVYNRPIFDVNGPSGGLIDRMGEHIDGKRQALIEHLKTRAPADEDEFDALYTVLIEYEASCGTSIGSIRKLVLNLEAMGRKARKGGVS